MDEKETWQAALGELEVVLSKANFTTWFKDTFVQEIRTDEIIIGVPNTFSKEWLENKFHNDISAALKKLHPQVKNIKYSVANSSLVKSQPIIAAKPEAEKQTRQENLLNPTLNPKYVFETYIVGNSNRLAAATAQAVAAKPGNAYNPLFIYGGVGLGKTHLVQAIGNEILRKNPKKKIIYVSSEKFTNDFIQSISSGKINNFKKNYRDADVLIVDDIQFLSGKEGTQEEFFHTFNALHQSNRQIIITSDRVPKAIPQLEERLSSRFGWGMVADIQSPNLEMRQAILKSKCDEKQCPLPDDVLMFIAENIESNIRELEGAINRVVSYSDLNNVDPSTDIASKALADIVAAKEKHISTEKIFTAVCDFFEIEISDLLSPRRNKELVRPRHIVMYLLRHEMNLSYPKIGNELNKKDHTTIIHGVNKIEKEIARNEEIQKELSSIKEKIHK
jgi:chromosomal replication initiator protein